PGSPRLRHGEARHGRDRSLRGSVPDRGVRGLRRAGGDGTMKTTPTNTKATAPVEDARVLEPTIFELSRPGRRGFRVPEEGKAGRAPHGIPQRFLRAEPPDLPENAELAVLRHYTRLSTLNHHIEKEMYPLGSCTMKYNPKMSEAAADMPGFRDLHPMQ